MPELLAQNWFQLGIGLAVFLPLLIILIIGGVLCTSAADTILLAGLYIYAEEKEVPDAFDADAFKHAFK